MELKDFSYQFHNVGKEGADFRPSDREESNDGPNYFGFVTETGRYIIIKDTITGDVTNTRYAYGRSGYTTAWTNRASLDYYYYYELKGLL